MNTLFTIRSERPFSLAFRLQSADFSHLAQEVRTHFAELKNWQNMPLILDLRYCTSADFADMAELLAILHRENVHPVMLYHPDHSWKAIAEQLGLVYIDNLSQSKRETIEIKSIVSGNPPPVVTERLPAEISSIWNPAMIVNRRVRSGEKIIAENCDLICLDSVSRSAELWSDGNIFVYGEMMGRAYAGRSGNRQSMIYIQKMDAQLISLGGQYQIFDHISSDYRGKNVRFYWDNEQMRMRVL